MARTKSVDNQALLAAALEGLEIQKQRIEEQIRQVRSMLGRRGGRVTSESPVLPMKAPRKRQLSEAARKRIAAAQKRRWAEYRKQGGQGKES